MDERKGDYMDFLDFLKQRRSYRQYTGEPVEKELLDRRDFDSCRASDFKKR